MSVSYGNRIGLFITFWIGGLFLLNGQNPAAVKDRINSVKLDAACLYAEVTHQDANLAYENALSELLLTVNDLRESNGKPVVQVSDLTGRVEQLEYKRGEKIVVFVYISANKALAIARGKIRGIVIGEDESEVPSKLQTLESGKQSQAVSTRPVETELKQPDPAVSVSEPVNAELKAMADDEVARLVLQIEMVTDIKGFMDKFKTQGKVSSYGVAHSMEDIQDSAYLILYDRTWAIQTVLSPSFQGKRLNLRNNEADAVSKYRGYGVFWYKK